MARSPILVLVVDDFEPFRQFLSSTLHTANGFDIREASEGVEAVQKAEELHPDLILLDIGLPKLNGMEAARRIAKVSPQSRIIFISQESSPEVVQEAFRLGARGYIVKTDAARELLPAVNVVLRDERFTGSRFDGHQFAATSDVPVSASAQQKNQSARHHEAQFYSDDESFLEGFTQFIDSSLKAGNAVIVLATESHQHNLLPRLQARGLDIPAALKQGRFISLDPSDMLSTCMVGDRLDRARFVELTNELIARAAGALKGEHGRIAACGECAPILWEQGKIEAALGLERLWDEFARTHNLHILCGYMLSSFPRGQENEMFERIRAEHSTVSTL